MKCAPWFLRKSVTILAAAIAAAGCLAGCASASIKNQHAEERIMFHSAHFPSKALPVFAHRGFRGIAPENTLLAARKGWESGADCWELDVAASSDGVLVVIHDDTLVRTTDARSVFPDRKPWTVYDFTLEELKRLDAGSWYRSVDQFGQIASGRVTEKDLAGFASLRIPTLREALELTRDLGWEVNIEIKDATGRPCDAWIVEKTAVLVRELGMEKTVLISSFNHAYLARMKKAAPEIAVAALIDKPVEDPVGLLKGLDAVALNPNHRYLDAATVKKVREAGFDVYPWTGNEIADMERLVAWGVSGIITDFPDRALEVLGRKVGRSPR